MLFVVKIAPIVEKIYFLLENNDKNVDFGVFSNFGLPQKYYLIFKYIQITLKTQYHEL